MSSLNMWCLLCLGIMPASELSTSTQLAVERCYKASLPSECLSSGSSHTPVTCSLILVWDTSTEQKTPPPLLPLKSFADKVPSHLATP